jgi:hypothetical protein
LGFLNRVDEVNRRGEDHQFRAAQNSERIDQFNPIVLDSGICHGNAPIYTSIAVFLVVAWAVGADGSDSSMGIAKPKGWINDTAKVWRDNYSVGGS